MCAVDCCILIFGNNKKPINLNILNNDITSEIINIIKIDVVIL